MNRKNTGKPKTNFTLPAKRKKINQTLNEEKGEKYETVTGHLPNT